MREQKIKTVRVRFAPSPTGYLHVGGARTAIFNWLFARKHSGKFLLRLEDTDVARSGQEMVDAIIHGLKWLGLDWDEEPVYQSHRFDIYKKAAHELIAKDRAYKCFCSAERLQQVREKAVREKSEYKYDRHCRNLSPEEIKCSESAGTRFVIRLKVGEGETVFSDEVYGNIKFNNSQIDDFVLLRSDGHPTYHLAVVVDDNAMAITHVIRGDDHLSNTPKHILLYRAFGWQPPVFAHVPLILGPDKQRLSKRHGATSVSEYEKAGYLPEAVMNFLALLGWSSGDDRELFAREELIREFTIAGISKKSAVFDEKKLKWMNGQYLNRMDAEKLLELVMPQILSEQLLNEEAVRENRDYLLRVVKLLQPRLKRLSEFSEKVNYFLREPETYEEKAVSKYWQDETVIDTYNQLIGRLEKVAHFKAENIEPVIRNLAEELGLSAAKLIHPIRLALTGQEVSPGIFEVTELLGKETVLRRLRKAIRYLEDRTAPV